MSKQAVGELYFVALKSICSNMTLYKYIGNEMKYWSISKRTRRVAVIYSGTVGLKGEGFSIKSEGVFSKIDKYVKDEIEGKIEEGYRELEPHEYSWLEIEYEINGFGTEEDLRKRHLLENRMDDVLGVTGLGYSSGGDMGNGVMGVGCSVVDFEIAKRIIEQDLLGTDFSNYLRVYKKRF